MFSHRLHFSRRFQKSTPKMANLAFVRKANKAIQYTLPESIRHFGYRASFSCTVCDITVVKA